MDHNNIKNKLNKFLAEYQEKIGSFSGILLIHDFVEYIKNTPKINSILKEQILYVESQQKIMLKMSKNEIDSRVFNTPTINLEKPETWTDDRVFVKEFNTAKDIIKNKLPFNPIQVNISVCLSYILIIHEGIKRAKEDIKDDPKKSKEITKALKEFSSTLLPFNILDNKKEKSLSIILPNLLLKCLQTVSSYITTELEAEDFLKNKKSAPNMRFNKDESVLSIGEYNIKISRMADLPIDHHILQAIFDNEDLSYEVYYKDVAFLRDPYEDYDKDNDWRMFYRACEHLNNKIKRDTKNKIIDFIERHKKWCKINPKYIEC